MNVALFYPPNPILSSPEAHIGLGLLYVSRALRRAGHEVQIVDLRARGKVLPQDTPDVEVVGITATSGEVSWAREIARLARDRGMRTMIGGAHATFMPQDVADFDYTIVGDGELAAVEALKKGPGKYCLPLKDLAGLFPDWGLIGERGFSRELFTGAGYGQGPLAAGVLSSRGCPYRCSYCRADRDKVRYRPPGDVMIELQGLISKGIQHFRFYDESLTLDKKRALELFDMLKALKRHFRAHTRSDAWDDELAEVAKAAGCEEMGFGFEAASDKVLERVRKQETVEQHRQAVRVCKRAGIICKAFWMVGLPGQGWREIDDIKKFMLEARPDKWIVSLFAPYYGSDVRAHPEEYGVSWIDPDLSHYWNFAAQPTIAYEDNPREAIGQQYHELKIWLEENFRR